MANLSKIEIMENNSSSSNNHIFLSVCLLILAAVIIAASIVYLKKDEINKRLNKSEVEINCDVEQFVPLTVEEAVEAFKIEKRDDLLYRRYVALDPIIIEAIYTKIGTTATLYQIMSEYEANKSYYLSLQASHELPEINMNGPDKDKVRLSVTATVDTTDTEKKIPVAPAE